MYCCNTKHTSTTTPEPVAEEDQESLDRSAPADPCRYYGHGDQGAEGPNWSTGCFSNLKTCNQEAGFALEGEHVGVKSSSSSLLRLAQATAIIMKT